MWNNTVIAFRLRSSNLHLGQNSKKLIINMSFCLESYLPLSFVRKDSLNKDYSCWYTIVTVGVDRIGRESIWTNFNVYNLLHLQKSDSPSSHSLICISYLISWSPNIFKHELCVSEKRLPLWGRIYGEAETNIYDQCNFVIISLHWRLLPEDKKYMLSITVQDTKIFVWYEKSHKFLSEFVFNILDGGSLEWLMEM